MIGASAGDLMGSSVGIGGICVECQFAGVQGEFAIGARAAAVGIWQQLPPMTSSLRSAATTDLNTIEVRRSCDHGQRVFALRDLRQGQVVGHYKGRRFAPDQFHAGWDDQLTYLFGLSDGSVIDGAQGGNATRFINHACEPNVEAIERRASNGELSVVIRTTCAITSGAELFLDDALVIAGDDPADYPCECGKGSGGGTMAAPVALQAAAD